MGGQGVSFLWDRVLADCPAVDSCCMYEGDDTVRELWRKILAGAPIRDIDGLYTRVGAAVEAPPRPRRPVHDLDALPFVSRVDGADLYRGGHATMYTSRGCAAHCSFCQSGNYGNRYHKLSKWRHRSAPSIVEEIQRLGELGIHAISIVDDDFLGGDGRGRQRAVEFAELLARRGLTISFSIECRVDEIDREILSSLRAAGLRHVLIGIESANRLDDNLFAKKVSTEQIEAAIALLRELDIDFSSGFIMFHPLSSPAGLRQNLEFLAKHEIGTYRRVTNRLELYPGAPLLSYYRRRDIQFREERYRLYYDFADPRVAHYYRLVRRILRPFAVVENAAQRARYTAETRTPIDQARLESIYRISRRVSAELVRAAIRCLDLAEDATVSGAAAFEVDIAATTAALSREVAAAARTPTTVG